jgi:hypothetical protein
VKKRIKIVESARQLIVLPLATRLALEVTWTHIHLLLVHLELHKEMIQWYNFVFEWNLETDHMRVMVLLGKSLLLESKTESFQFDKKGELARYLIALALITVPINLPQ